MENNEKKTFNSEKDMLYWLLNNEGQILKDGFGRQWSYQNNNFWFKDIGTESEMRPGINCTHLYRTISIPVSPDKGETATGEYFVSAMPPQPETVIDKGGEKPSLRDFCFNAYLAGRANSSLTIEKSLEVWDEWEKENISCIASPSSIVAKPLRNPIMEELRSRITPAEQKEIDECFDRIDAGKSLEDAANMYLGKQYVDYGDLNEQAEKQIKDAFINGALYASQQQEWIIVEKSPNEEKDYAVIYKGGDVGKLTYWRGFWGNGNVDVSDCITHYIELPTEI